ncbi:MAG: hypothetical protein O7D86_12110 [Proteobacteria bacterium]|nr:hypothetical protein [Pseudomonadota bacterium]
MNRFLTISLLLILSSQLSAQDLPGRHKLKQNETGEYFVVNHKNIMMIEPSILKLGYNAKWILACIKNKSIDSDLKRWVFVDVKNGGTYDALHQENWVYFRDEAFPELKEIKLTDYSNESCP